MILVSNQDISIIDMSWLLTKIIPFSLSVVSSCVSANIPLSYYSKKRHPKILISNILGIFLHSIIGYFKPQDFKFHGQQFFGSVARDHGKLSVIIFQFRENSQEPTFISFFSSVSVSWKHVVKHTFKLKNISVYLLFTKNFNVY